MQRYYAIVTRVIVPANNLIIAEAAAANIREKLEYYDYVVESSDVSYWGEKVTRVKDNSAG